MPNASFVQTVFLGGEWSTYASARTDSQRYKTAMNVCLNSYPREEGGWTRRPGFRFLANTKSGLAARIFSFDLDSDEQYVLEFGNLYARFFRNGALVLESTKAVSAFSAATPTEVTSAAHGFTTGDHVVFVFDGSVLDNVIQGDVLRNRQFVATVTSATKFTIVDAITGATIAGTSIDYSGTGISVARILQKTTTFATTPVASMRVVQGEQELVTLAATLSPQYITFSSTTPSVATVAFLDGPYLDENTTTTTLTPSGVSGSVTVTASSIVGINSGTGFQTTDVGRHIRLFWEPAIWVSAAAYAVGDVVTYEGQYYSAIKAIASSLKKPAEDLTAWVPTTNVAMWTWLKITARSSTTVVTATVMGDPLTTAKALTVWRLGVFCDTLGWPTIGTHHEGRLWLGGVIPNRADGSGLIDRFTFTPTAKDGTVSDDNAISATAGAEDRQKAVWMRSTDDGLMLGTEGGEWIGGPASVGEPLTPDNFKFKRVSRYRCANQEPAIAGALMLFVQRSQQKVMEFPIIGDGGKVTANNLSLAFRHRLEIGVDQIVYQPQPNPTVWARRTDGTLVGCTYKRDSSEYYAGWHRHELGNDRLLHDMAIGPSVDEFNDALWVVAYDDVQTNKYYTIEVMRPPFEDSLQDFQAHFVDKGVVPSGGQITDGGDTLTFYGLWPLEGFLVSAMIGGLDCGDFTVDDGKIVIPIDGDPLTSAFLQELDDAGVDYLDFEVKIVSLAP